MICSIENCNRKNAARGWCKLHYYRWKRQGDPNKVLLVYDGRKGHPLYTTYSRVKQRCFDKNDPNYYLYGGRGITICDRWLGLNGFPRFVEDMGAKPKGTSIDRIDTDGNYEPSNCRWANNTLQAINQRGYRNNKSGVKGVYFNKEQKKWCAQLKINRKTLFLGYFGTVEDAAEARLLAEVKHHNPILEGATK